jgi:hypothetical protein
MALIVIPLRYISLITNRFSTLSIGGLLPDTPGNQAIVPEVRPPGKSGDFYFGPFGDFTIGRDIYPDEREQYPNRWMISI